MAKRKHRTMRYEVYRVIDTLKSHRDAYTNYDLHEELGMHPKTAYRHLRELWALELIYICGWDREHNQPIPAYRWGNKPDVERPEPRR